MPSKTNSWVNCLTASVARRSATETHGGSLGLEVDTRTMAKIREEPVGGLRHHGEISIAFEVASVFDIEVIEGGLGGVRFTERPVEAPWVKDYDLADGGPPSWVSRFDVSRWGLLSAYADDDRHVGGAVIAFDTPDLHMLRGQRDLAVLWDLRVADHARRTGTGKALFRAAESWARQRGCVALEVETQQVNVPACRFYAQMGCSLGALDLHAYPDAPEETRLIWRRQLDPTR